MLTVWDSLKAIERFAGPNLDNAVVEPAAQAVLAGYDTTVTHHTVVVDTVGRALPPAGEVGESHGRGAG